LVLAVHAAGALVSQPGRVLLVDCDIDSPLENTVQTVVQNDPDRIYVPISQPHEALGLLHLPDTLSVIAALEQRAGRSPWVTIVPLGVAKGKIEAALRGARERPKRCSVAAKARALLRQTSAALAEGRYVWEYEGCRDQLDYFCSLVGVGQGEGKE
jgi:chromosome partitioning protein